MKTALLTVTFCFCLLFNHSMAQSEGISPTYSFSIKKKIEPPLLSFVPGSVQFLDVDGNNTINANEESAVLFELKNSGTGDGLNLKVLLSATGTTAGVRIQASQSIANVSKGGTTKYKLALPSGMDTQDGKIVLKLEVEEPNGFNSESVELEIATKKFAAPNIVVPDYTVFSADGSTNLELKHPFSLQLLVQNTGQGLAKNVNYRLILPENVFFIAGEESGSFITLNPGETKSLEFQLVMNAKFVGTLLNLELELKESYGKYATNWNGQFSLNQALAGEKFIVQARQENALEITEASLRSDVDKDIPLGLPQNLKKYALIVGNEDYSKYQPGLEQEVNVAFAANDARVFAEYAEKTLGVPKKNITVLIDATKGQMTQELAQLKRLIEVERGEAEVIFYYSGHGLPEESTNTPYLIPVDVSGTQPTNGLALQEVYSSLSAFPSKKVTVILDACFSGGARLKELVAMKAVKVKANVENVPANLVVLASSSGTEASAVYLEKQHGYFTYFLLKELKETKANANMKEALSRVQQNVSREAARIGKLQTPTVLLGTESFELWEVLKW
jgi:hypothetical protein